MLTFILKFQYCMMSNPFIHTIHSSSFMSIDSKELENSNVVITYPNESCIEYFQILGFRVHQYDKLPLNFLIFSNDEFLDFLLDENITKPDRKYPLLRVIYGV